MKYYADVLSLDVDGLPDWTILNPKGFITELNARKAVEAYWQGKHVDVFCSRKRIVDGTYLTTSFVYTSSDRMVLALFKDRFFTEDLERRGYPKNIVGRVWH